MSDVTSTNWSGCYDKSQNYIGNGTLTFSNKDTFRGVIYSSENDIWDGKGLYTYHNSGDTYNGEFIRHKRHGFGTYTWTKNKENYFRGKWEKDEMINGFFKCSKYSYDGDFKNNKKEGKGLYTRCTIGTYTYEGDWKNDKRHGKGKQVKPGVTYEGEWEDDLPHGIGVQKFKDGREWSGTWVKGVLQNGEFKGKLKTSIPKLPLI